MIHEKKNQIQFEYTYKDIPYLIELDVTAIEHVIVTKGDWDTPDDHERDCLEIEIHSSKVYFKEEYEPINDDFLENLIIKSVSDQDIWDML